MSNPPFQAKQYEFSGISLFPVDASKAAQLAAELVTIDPWKTLGFKADALAAYLTREDPACFRYVIAPTDENSDDYSATTPAGIAAVRFPWMRGPYLEFLGILPSAQGEGIGSKFMAWLEKRTIVSGCNNIWIAVSDFNSAARTFYEHAGYVHCAELDDLVAEGRAELLMRKKLS